MSKVEEVKITMNQKGANNYEKRGYQPIEKGYQPNPQNGYQPTVQQGGQQPRPTPPSGGSGVPQKKIVMGWCLLKTP